MRSLFLLVWGAPWWVAVPLFILGTVYLPWYALVPILAVYGWRLATMELPPPATQPRSSMPAAGRNGRRAREDVALSAQEEG